MNCNYRIYVHTRDGYTLAEITSDEEHALKYIEDTNYKKVLIVKRDFDKKRDEVYRLAFPQKKAKGKVNKKVRK